jgi:hypothetical protein
MSNIDFDALMTAAPAANPKGGKGIDFDALMGVTADSDSPPDRNVFARANDFAIDTGNAAAGLVKSGVDLVAPGSKPSKAIDSFIKESEAKQSDWKKAQRKKLGENIANAEGELDKVGAYLEHVKEDPAEVVAQAVGNVGPFRALGMAFKAAGWGTKAAMTAAGALSAGEVRGNILDKVLAKKDADLQAENEEYAKLRAGGMSEADAKHEIGTRFVQHLPEVGLAGLIGSLGGKWGLEGVAAGVGKPMKSRLAATAVSAADEGIQGAVEQVATNVGVRRIDGKQAIGEDVALNAVQEGLPGGIGGAVGHRAHGAPPAITPPPADRPDSAPTQSQQLVRAAFAEVAGDENVLQRQAAARGNVALSLNQIGQVDGQEALVQAIDHLSGGDQAIAEQLFDASQDQQLVNEGRKGLDTDAIGFIELNEGIRRDTGLLDDQAAPVANTATNVPNSGTTQPNSGTNSAGFVSEPIEQVAAQVEAVREGRKAAAVVGLQEASQLDLNGLAHAIATDLEGRQALIVSRSNELVQAAVERAMQVGLMQAAGETLGVVEPTATSEQRPRAVIQHVDNKSGQVLHEELVAPELVDKVKKTPGTTTVVKPVAQVIAERQAQQTASSLQPDVQPQSTPGTEGPTFFARKTPKQRRKAEVKVAPKQSGAAVKLVERINEERGLQGEEAIDPNSIVEVTPDRVLARLRDAVGTAFGTKLVFVSTPGGALMRKNGQRFSEIGGVASRGEKTIFLNVDHDMALNTLGHELAHILESEHPAIYDKLELVVLSRMRHGAALQLKQRLEKAAQSEGHGTDEFRREVVAEAIGEMAEDVQLWKDVFGHIGEDNTLAKKFYQLVMDVIAKLQRALTHAGYIEGIRDIANVKKAVTAAYKEWASEYERTGENLANLTPEAQEMLAQFNGFRATEASAEAAKKRKAAKEESKAAEKVEQQTTETPDAKKPEAATNKPPAKPAAKAPPKDDDEARMEGEGGISFSRKTLGEGYGRSGEIEDNERYKGGARKGQYVGAPAKYNTPAKIPALRRLLAELAFEGEPGKEWYERSGAAILEMVGGDVEEARKFIALLAIYSPQAKVDANSTFAIRAWAQYKAGEKIDVKTAKQDADATAVLYDNKPWGGEKTNNFYKNLMRAVDPETHGADTQGVTVDMWMMRAAGYDTDSPTDAAYRFVENETNRLARDLGWEPQQVQAAIWVALKARTENKEVKRKTVEQSIKKGYSEKVIGSKGKPVLKVLNESKHRQLWLKNTMDLEVREDDTNGAKFDFADGLRRHLGQISWEARPGRTTGVLPGVNDAPYEQQAEFQRAVAAALTGENGQDLLAEKLGLLVDGEVLAPGVWQGEVAAGMQSFVTMAPAKGGETAVDPAQRKLIGVYADVMGLLLRQEGVGWHKPFYATAVKDQNGLEFDVGRPLTKDEMRQVWEAFNAEMDAGWEDSVALISSSNGFRAVQFGGDNAAFRSAAARAVEATDLTASMRGFASDGDLATNDWKENPNGEGYRQRVSAAGRSDVLGWADSVLAGRVQAVFNDFAARYGWGDAGQPGRAVRRAERDDSTARPEDAPAQAEVAPSAPDTSFRRIETPEFKAWFGDSKVVDAHGKPLVVYHGTRSDVSRFDLNAPRNMATFRDAQGFYFTNDPRDASSYTEVDGDPASGANVLPVYLRIENPLRVESGDIDRHPAYVSPQRLSKLKADGYDGIIYAGGVELVVFSSDQIKSAIGNRGTFDATNPDITFQRSPLKMESTQDALDFLRSGNLDLDLGDAIQREAWADAWLKTKDANQRKGLLREIGDRTIELFADSKIRITRWIQGLPLPVNLAQRLEGDLRRSDTVRSMLEKQVKDQFTEPMMKAITKAARASKLSSDQVKKIAGYWMSAKYAPEANDWLIRKDRAALLAAQQSGDANMIAAAQKNLNDRTVDVYGQLGQAKVRGVAGGFNNAEAAEAVRLAEAKIDVKLLEDIARPVYAMMTWKKAKDLSVGKVSQTMVNSWLNSARYVPLTGDPRFDRESSDVFATGGAVNQDADKAMNGRKDSVSDDGIDAAFAAVIKSINFAAMQDFKRSLSQAWSHATATGIDVGLEREPVSGIMRTGDNVIIHRDVKKLPNGQEIMEAHAYRFKDERIMDALRRDNVEHVNWLLQKIATPTRWYGRLVTQFMPMFAPLNLVRDIWERSELLRTRKLYDAAGNVIDVDKAARASIADVLNLELWKASMMKAFKRGGMTATRGDLEEMIRLGGSSTTGDYLSRTASDLEGDIRGDASRLGHARNVVTSKVEAWNDTFEMIPSLAIYRALKKQGMAPKDAAAAVLDLMNFRKRGTAMPGIRALYIFAQPAATGGYNLAQYLATAKGRKRFAVQVILGTALYALLKGAWGDDDDEELGNDLDNLSNFVVERTIPIKLGEHMVKIPVGFGPPQLAWATAVTLNRWASDRYTTKDAVMELAKAWVKSSAPISPSDMEISKRPVDWLGQTFTPTVLKPLANIWTDQTAFGAPLTPRFKNADKLKSEQANRNTPPIYTDLARELHELTGIDMYPDHIKALTDGVLIGPMQEILKLTVDAEAKKLRGEPERMPLISQLVDTINDRQILNSVYNRVRSDMEQAHREYGALQGDPEKRGDITMEMRAQEQAYKRFAAAEKLIGQQRSALNKMPLDAEARAEKVQALEARADAERKKLLIQYMGER